MRTFMAMICAGDQLAGDPFALEKRASVVGDGLVAVLALGDDSVGTLDRRFVGRRFLGLSGARLVISLSTAAKRFEGRAGLAAGDFSPAVFSDAPAGFEAGADFSVVDELAVRSSPAPLAAVESGRQADRSEPVPYRGRTVCCRTHSRRSRWHGPLASGAQARTGRPYLLATIERISSEISIPRNLRSRSQFDEELSKTWRQWLPSCYNHTSEAPCSPSGVVKNSSFFASLPQFSAGRRRSGRLDANSGVQRLCRNSRSKRLNRHRSQRTHTCCGGRARPTRSSSIPASTPGLCGNGSRKRGLGLAAILNTHGHADHIAGNRTMKEAFPEAPLCIGQNEAFLLSDPEANMSAPFGQPLVSPEPDRMLADGERFKVAGFELEVREIPGHSPGSVVFLCEEFDPHFVIGGDVLFSGSVGRTDLGGDFGLLARGIHAKLFTLPDSTVIYPGHGPPTTIGVEKRSNPFVGAAAGLYDLK